MKPEIKEKWVKALRSGEYKQGRRSLRTKLPDGSCQHCCLGVLMEIEFGGFPPVRDPYTAIGDLVRDTIPAPVSTLIEMNDDERKSFKQIADYIEANL